MEQSPSWEAKSLSYSRNPPSFMEPQGSLPCSQKPATGPYPEADETNPHPPINIFLRPILIYLAIYA
jgi:hypothetical protein